MTTLEQLIEIAKTLPPGDRHQLRLWLQEQERQDSSPPSSATCSSNSVETVEQQLERFNKAMRWVDEHRAEYLGQWVVLVGDQLISHGADSRVVYGQAKAAGIAVPFLTQVTEQPAHFVNGFEICR